MSNLMRNVLASMVLVALIGCSPDPAASIEMRVDQESDTLTIVVFNHGRESILIDGQLLDASRENDIVLEIVSSSSESVKRCRGIDYIGTAEEITIAPGTSESIRLSLLAIAMSHCLVERGEYKIRAVMEVPSGHPPGEVIVSESATFSAPAG